MGNGTGGGVRNRQQGPRNFTTPARAPTAPSTTGAMRWTKRERDWLEGMRASSTPVPFASDAQRAAVLQFVDRHLGDTHEYGNYLRTDGSGFFGRDLQGADTADSSLAQHGIAMGFFDAAPGKGGRDAQYVALHSHPEAPAADAQPFRPFSQNDLITSGLRGDPLNVVASYLRDGGHDYAILYWSKPGDQGGAINTLVNKAFTGLRMSRTRTVFADSLVKANQRAAAALGDTFGWEVVRMPTSLK